MKFIRITWYIFIYIFILLSVQNQTVFGATSLFDSVDYALQNNPQLQTLAYNNQALEYDLKKSRSGYLPSVDVLLGYGLEQHSDDVTRSPGANPGDTDWDPRTDAELTVTQPVYDGGETRSEVSIRKAVLDTGMCQLQAAAQAIALDAVIAHLTVFWQHELVALAEKNLKIHSDIYQSLSEREQAGAGNISDVTQAQARLALAKSTLYKSRADLRRAMANYKRVIGKAPEALSYPGIPGTLPQTLEEALQRTEQGNPELLALNAEIDESKSRLSLARSKYKPKIDFELSSRYNDQLEGDDSWTNTNAAMLFLRWNLYSGGGDRANVNAALVRRQQHRSNRVARLVELKEETSAAWANYLSLQQQKPAYRDAMNYSRETFNAYVKQFSLSQRGLLDVLIVENDYFRSASQLVTVSLQETITAYRILALGGALEIPKSSEIQKYPESFENLRSSLSLPVFDKGRREDAAADDGAVPASASVSPPLTRSPLSYSVEIGPCIMERGLTLAKDILLDHGFVFQQTSGVGKVRFTRLFEGTYAPDEARRRLAVLKEIVDSAFVVPQGEQLGLYAGSFRDHRRAVRFAEVLRRKQIAVTPVNCDLWMRGSILIVRGLDQQDVEKISEQMSKLGLTVSSSESVFK
jgi:adhesin transport system outer membrane protein